MPALGRTFCSRSGPHILNGSEPFVSGWSARCLLCTLWCSPIPVREIRLANIHCCPRGVSPNHTESAACAYVVQLFETYLSCTYSVQKQNDDTNCNPSPRTLLWLLFVNPRAFLAPEAQHTSCYVVAVMFYSVPHTSPAVLIIVFNSMLERQIFFGQLRFFQRYPQTPRQHALFRSAWGLGLGASLVGCLRRRLRSGIAATHSYSLAKVNPPLPKQRKCLSFKFVGKHRESFT